MLLHSESSVFEEKFLSESVALSTSWITGSEEGASGLRKNADQFSASPLLPPGSIPKGGGWHLIIGLDVQLLVPGCKTSYITWPPEDSH